MSFGSENAVMLQGTPQECFDLLSNPETFCAFMESAPITKEISITCIDYVAVSEDLTVTDLSGAEGEERCLRINFELVELITHFGISKEIPVVGSLVVVRSKLAHIDHRVASSGLVTTHNVRRFLPASEPASEDEDSCAGTKVQETLDGKCSWYLKIFTEAEARKSHLAFMDKYSSFIASLTAEST